MQAAGENAGETHLALASIPQHPATHSNAAFNAVIPVGLVLAVSFNLLFNQHAVRQILGH